MKDMFNNLIEKVKVWGEKDWDNNVNEDGEFEVYDNVGGLDFVLKRNDYFGGLEEVKNFSELESWWMSIMGMDGDGGFVSWLDEVSKG